MSNELFRNRAVGAIQQAMREYDEAKKIGHAGMVGRVREIAVERLLTPFLSRPFEIGTGKIVDHEDQQSAETDVIVYSRTVLPPIMYSERDGIFPSEACFYALEVKSTLSATELDNSIAKARRLTELRYASGQRDSEGNTVHHMVTRIVPAVFAFDSDLASDGKSEFARYRERDANWRTDPAVRGICIPRRGYWWFEMPTRRWLWLEPTPVYDEVIEFLAQTVNQLHAKLAERGQPALGHYITLTGRRARLMSADD